MSVYFYVHNYIDGSYYLKLHIQFILYLLFLTYFS